MTIVDRYDLWTEARRLRRREWYLVDDRGRAELVMYSGAGLLHLYRQPPFGTYSSVAPCPPPR